MIKLLIGGSPCTKWSIAQKNNRETEPSGIGWELFRNYVIAKEKFKPDLFLYENNKSAAQPIKDEISKELSVDLMYINSAAVSAQNRQRFYAFNWRIEQPRDRGILLADILESGQDLCGNEKSYCLTASYDGAVVQNTLARKQRTMVAEPIQEANWEIIEGAKIFITERAMRQGDLNGTKQGKYVYLCLAKKTNTISASQAHNEKVIVPAPTGTWKTIYKVHDREIEIKGRVYPINLPDGCYIIRKLTPVECERLQTLPDGYTASVSNMQRYKGLGNSWTAEVIIHILNGALQNVPRDEDILCLSMYDGIGTGRYCLDKMGFTNVKYYAYEIDKFAMKIANSNYPDIIQCGDAFNVRKDDWKIGG